MVLIKGNELLHVGCEFSSVAGLCISKLDVSASNLGGLILESNPSASVSSLD